MRKGVHLCMSLNVDLIKAYNSHLKHFCYVEYLTKYKYKQFMTWCIVLYVQHYFLSSVNSKANEVYKTVKKIHVNFNCCSACTSVRNT
jgi:hypothetical protein